MNKQLEVTDAVWKVEWKEFACGWCASFVNITITYPVNKIIFRQMLHGVKAYRAILQLHNEGIYYLYRGMLPPLFQKTFSMSIMFGVYDQVKTPLIGYNFNPYLAKAIGGLVAGTLEAILMPFERIQTLLADATYHKEFTNTLHAFRKIGQNYGFREYYRGAVPILLRNGPSNACFFIIKDEMQHRFPKKSSTFHHTLTEFICGALIGATLSGLFYPLNVVKVCMQSRVGGEYQNVFKVLSQVYKERGGKIRYIYTGVHTNCTRAFLSWGVMNAAYENIKKLFVDDIG